MEHRNMRNSERNIYHEILEVMKCIKKCLCQSFAVGLIMQQCIDLESIYQRNPPGAQIARCASKIGEDGLSSAALRLMSDPPSSSYLETISSSMPVNVLR